MYYKNNLFIFTDMNFKLLTATTLFISVAATLPAFSYDKDELQEFKNTGECVDCNLSRAPIGSSYSSLEYKNSNLQGANLRSASLYRSNFKNSNFSYADFKKANLRYTDLRNANFSYTDVSGANFCDSDLRGINWTGIVYNNMTQCLPDIAIDYVHPVSDESNNTGQHCHNNHLVSSSNKQRF